MRLFVRTTVKLHFLLVAFFVSILTIAVVGCGGTGPSGRGTTPIPPVNPGPGTSATPNPTPMPTASSNFAEFVVPSAASSLSGLTLGPDGNTWFTEGTSLKIGYVTPGGSVSEISVASISSNPGSSAGNIAPGGGQALWFAFSAEQGSPNFYSAYLQQVATSGALLASANQTSCVGPNECYFLTALEPGPAGTVLFANEEFAYSAGGGVNTILGEITPSGQVSALDNTPSNGIPGTALDVVQTSGAAWASWQSYSFSGPPSAPAVTSISSAGTISAYAIPSSYQPASSVSPGAGLPSSDTAYSTWQDLTIGSDGAPWIALNGTSGSALGRIASNGAITLHAVSSANVQIAGITTGADGALWFTEATTNKIGRMTTSGTLTEYPVPTAQAGLGRIIAGANSTLWFTEVWANKIGRYTY